MSRSNYRDTDWGAAPGSEATKNNGSAQSSNAGNNQCGRANPWTRQGPMFAQDNTQNAGDGSNPQRGKIPVSDAFDFSKNRPRTARGGQSNFQGGQNRRNKWSSRTEDEGKDSLDQPTEKEMDRNDTQDQYEDKGGHRGGGRGRGYQPQQNGSNNFWSAARPRSNWQNRNSFRDGSDPVPNTEEENKMFQGIVPVDAEERDVLQLFAKTRMSTGINFSKYQAIPVKCVPENVCPMETFESMNLEESLLENVKRAGYTRPTPIQKYALPIVTKGRDLMACAQTGSGKTAAFLIPVIQDILTNGKARLPPQLREKHKGEAVPSGMILAPTRELTLQIHDEARKFCFRTGLRSVVIYGGVDAYVQKQELHRGCDIIVATPGRLWDLYLQGCMFLACVRTVILDEADRMLDLGFEEQIRHIMQNSDLPQTSDRQTLLFSATFPTMIQTLAKNYLRSYFFVTVGRVGSTTEGITQRVGYAKADEKLQMVENLIQKDPNVLTLIFVERKSTAEDLKISLSQSGFRVDTIHGDRHQLDRERALTSFRNGEVTVLVATDVASRGLDIPNVAHVIQYDMPSSMDDYIHRIGRTGRAGNVGIATALFTDDDARMATELVEILREHNQSVPEWLSDVMLRTIQDKSRHSNYKQRNRR